MKRSWAAFLDQRNFRHHSWFLFLYRSRISPTCGRIRNKPNISLEKPPRRLQSSAGCFRVNFNKFWLLAAAKKWNSLNLNVSCLHLRPSVQWPSDLITKFDATVKPEWNARMMQFRNHFYFSINYIFRGFGTNCVMGVNIIRGWGCRHFAEIRW